MGAHELLHARIVGDGAPMLLIHGDFNTGAMAWRRQLDRPRGHRLIVPDRRGYGASPPLTGPHAVTGDASDILRLADDLGLDRFDLAGHSYGGLVAIEVAAAAPERVHSLVLVEPPLLALLPDDPEVVLLRERTGVLWAAADGMNDDQIAARFFETVAGRSDVARLRSSPGWPALVGEARRAVRGQPPALFPADALDRLNPRLGVAVLSGGRSHPGLRAIAQEIARRVPGAAFVLAPSQGHAAQFDETAFAAAVAAAAPDGDRQVGESPGRSCRSISDAAVH